MKSLNVKRTNVIPPMGFARTKNRLGKRAFPIANGEASFQQNEKMETEGSSYWVHDLDPVIFQITETLAVRWYGVAYLAGFFVAWLLLRAYHRSGRVPITPAMRETYFLWMVLGVIVGGRLGYMFLYDLGEFLANPLILFQVWEGGMASHGGFIGVAAAAAWVARKWQMPMLRVWDLTATVSAAGLFLGRLANFINGELWGKISTVPWAVIFPKSAPGMPVEFIEPRHPSQLYQAGMEGLLLFVYMQFRFWRGQAFARPGQLCGEFIIGYGILRILGEVYREPDASLIWGMSRGTAYSWLFVGIGIALFAYARMHNRSVSTAK